MLSILLPNRLDSDSFPAHPTGRHILAGGLLGWVDGEGQLGTWGACCLFTKGCRFSVFLAPSSHHLQNGNRRGQACWRAMVSVNGQAAGDTCRIYNFEKFGANIGR